MATPQTRVRLPRHGTIWIVLAAAILAAALLKVLWPNMVTLASRKETASQSGPENIKSRLREPDPEDRKGGRKKADPVLVRNWMNELLEHFK